MAGPEQNKAQGQAPRPVAKPAPAGKPADENFRHLVRIANTDLDGSKALIVALTKIQGIGDIFSNAVCNIAGVDKTKKTGDLSDEEIKKLDSIISKPAGYDIPDWMLNRRKDFDSGENIHLITGDLKFFKENDIKRMKKIKCYVGVRHSSGLPVRGQRTKSNFRKNKGKGKGALGVQRKKANAGRV